MIGRLVVFSLKCLILNDFPAFARRKRSLGMSIFGEGVGIAVPISLFVRSDSDPDEPIVRRD
jgi:hypothetical protein